MHDISRRDPAARVTQSWSLVQNEVGNVGILVLGEILKKLKSVSWV